VKTIDLNCDLGELPESIRSGTDETLMRWVSSANIACGGHAGDDESMESSVRAALRHGVAVGAHPGYPDRAGFGRVAMAMTPAEIEVSVRTQVNALGAIAQRFAVPLVHVKPHGALYHAASRDLSVAEAIARAVAAWNANLVLVGLAGSPVLGAWRSLGFAVAAEAFADRLYEADGSLRSRRHADALLTEPARAAEQAARIARGDGVVARDGSVVAVEARTLCVHGDTPGAVAVARAVRERLEAEGFRVEHP